MKKWVCFLNNHAYDPANSQLPAELRGAAVCRWVEDQDYERIISRNRRTPLPGMITTGRAEFRKSLKPCCCRGVCRCY